MLLSCDEIWNLMIKKESQEIADIETWFSDCQKSLCMDIQRIAAADSKDWEITETPDGRPNEIAHHTKRFHKIAFLRVWEPLRKQWIDRCLLEPIAEGKDNNFAMAILTMHQEKYLLQAKAEPGNSTPGGVMLTTTVQASHTNISMSLSGEVPFTEFYNHPACRKFSIVQDGGQFLNKKNEVCLIELQEKPKNIPKSFYWATLAEIKNFASRGLVSEYLMQAFGMLYLS